MIKRYQVFVSSTYADLKEERSKVIQTIMELDCIPAGMEIFPAIDEEQFNFIKRVIDDCDYYLLIIGGRYGSVSEDGISYTEKEYDYAIGKGLKVIAFIHGNPDAIPLGKSEKDQDVREKLNKFKQKVSSNRLIKFWNNAEELPGLVALSLSKTIKTYPAIGWIRANSVTNPEILQELNDQRKENQELKEQVAKYSNLSIDNEKTQYLAGLDDEFEISGANSTVMPGPTNWEIKTTWGEIFSLVSPHLLNHPADRVVKVTLSNIFFNKSKIGGYNAEIDDQIYQTIKIHLKSLGLINVDYLKTVKGGMALFWSLTKNGETLMDDLRSVKKQ